MVTIRECPTLEEAELIQSVLRGSGVEAFLPDENSAFTGMGGVLVQVAREDADRANDVLRQRDNAAPEAS